MTETRRPAPVDRPVTLTVAGSDSGGGAGIQADLKTMEACGAFGTSVITAVTAQNTRGVDSSFVLPLTEIEAQFEAVTSDFSVGAAKTGMLATADVIELVTNRARSVTFPLVVDPVMVAASGDRLLAEAAEDAYEDLVGEARLVTPNADEAAVLTGVDPEDEAGARLAGQRLLAMGADAALITGGHLPGDEVLDVLVTEEYIETARHPRIETEASHGSGCMLSAAITARLASGEALRDAVARSVALMERAVRYHHDVGTGPGAVHHLVDLRNEAARHPTAEAVTEVVHWAVDRDVTALVPEVGMNVVGATPYAEDPTETAAVEGRITRTLSGVAPNRGVRFGASSHVARFLLAAREFRPDLRFAVNCRFDDGVEAALENLDGPVAEYDRDEEPASVAAEEGSTMQWAARQTFDRAEVPLAVIDRGAHGKEPILKLVSTDERALAERIETLLDALDG